MSKNDIIAALAEAFGEVGGIDASAVRTDASLFVDLNADSMVIAEALLIVEERFGLTVSDDFAEEMTTVGDLAEHILSAGSSSAA
jgi:acyl carrier protein